MGTNRVPSMSKTKSKIVIHRGYVKIHYQNQTRTRISTGVKLPVETVKDNPYFSVTRGQLTSKYKGYKQAQVSIDNIKSKVDEIIRDFQHKHKVYPTGEQLRDLYEDYKEEVHYSPYLVEMYNNYYEQKKIEFDGKNKSKESIKDYRGLKYHLEDFDIFCNKKQKLADISPKWLNKFNSFLSTKRDKTVKPYQLTGPLGEASIKKKMGLFVSFFKYLDKTEKFKFPICLDGYVKTLNKGVVHKSTLTKEEIMLLYEQPLTRESDYFVRDTFVFTCFVGCRWSDLVRIDKTVVKRMPNGKLLLRMNAQKTKSEFRVWLNPIAEDIITRYEYDFTRYSNANFNKKLKRILEESLLFHDLTKFEDDKGRKLSRYEVISIHRGRDTFCTLLMENRVPINEIMKYTGHQTISSLTKYIDTDREPNDYTNELIYERD